MDDLLLKKIIQIVNSSGLWMRMVAKDGQTYSGPEFSPIVAIALVEVDAPHDRFFLSEGVLPLTADDLAICLVENGPNERLCVDRTIYHDADFEDVGYRLKGDAVPRAHTYLGASGIDYAYFLQDRERQQAGVHTL